MSCPPSVPPLVKSLASTRNTTGPSPRRRPLGEGHGIGIGMFKRSFDWKIYRRLRTATVTIVAICPLYSTLYRAVRSHMCPTAVVLFFVFSCHRFKQNGAIDCSVCSDRILEANSSVGCSRKHSASTSRHPEGNCAQHHRQVELLITSTIRHGLHRSVSYELYCNYSRIA